MPWSVFYKRWHAFFTFLVPIAVIASLMASVWKVKMFGMYKYQQEGDGMPIQ
jgi:hypothetical protein